MSSQLTQQCRICDAQTPLWETACRACGSTFPGNYELPMLRSENDGYSAMLRVSEGFAGLHEEVTEREYDPEGHVRYERIARRAWLVPGQPTPFPTLRALSSDSFGQRVQFLALPELEQA